MADASEKILGKLQELEERIARLEAGAPRETDVGDFTFVEETAPQARTLPRRPLPRGKREPFRVTQVLGWGGVLALVLAAAYLIKLGIDLGWLTPARQVLLAFIGGAALILSGLALRRSDREYASLLPAGGIVILFLTTYGAHLYYRLIGYPAATGIVVLICVLSLWLCRLFASDMYAYLAIFGSYTAPLLLKGLRADVIELAIYFSAWSVVYCVLSIWLQQRRIYLIAAYLALLGFDLIWYQQWHHAPEPQWQAALIFQAIQFTVFAIATAVYTLQHELKLDQTEALGHLPPLLLFYALEYALLDRYLHQFAPWIAFTSLALLFAFYLVARYAFRNPLEGGQLILSSYAAIVLFHAGYLELLPAQIAPWAGLAVGLVLAGWWLTRKQVGKTNWPLFLGLALVFVINTMRTLLNFDLDRVVGNDYLALAYAAELYAAWFFLRKAEVHVQFKAGLLYTGHLAAMAAPVHLFDDRLPVSFCWALLAVIALMLALRIRERLLAQSSLFIFAVSGAKVLLYDLDHAAPLIRIGCLIILGISFYIGGWLYRKVGEIDH